MWKLTVIMVVILFSACDLMDKELEGVSSPDPIIVALDSVAVDTLINDTLDNYIVIQPFLLEEKIVIRIGQVWCYEDPDPNPFDTTSRVRYDKEVLNIKDGWVQYRDLTTNRVSSVRGKLFIFDSKLKR